MVAGFFYYILAVAVLIGLIPFVKGTTELIYADEDALA